MATNTSSRIEPKGFQERERFVVAGMNERYSPSRRMQIPQQWERFAPYIGKVPGQMSAVTYGVMSAVDDSHDFDYMTAVEVREGAQVPKELSTLQIQRQRYAVFAHPEHVSRINETMSAIIADWLPHSGNEAARAPAFERYGERFDPKTGRGDIEIWVPVQQRAK